jgi:NAD(P)-dependent dehydrogenase (short-subunit alcohol dehydrogenase family)
VEARDTMLITGASSGVGLSLAHHFADRFAVVATARSVDVLHAEFDDAADVTVCRMDLADPAGTMEALEEILEQDHVPYLINNAGVNVAGTVEELLDEEIARSLQVNALSPLMIMRRLLQPMKERGFGRIVNMTSGAPLNCFPGYSAYSASKGALNALTVTAAREYADCDIKINLMSPGPVRSKMAPDGPLDPSVCHATADYLVSLDADGPTGRFFWLGRELPLFPDLDGIEWLEGRADGRYRRAF